MNEFYMCLAKDSGRPKVIHTTRQKAETEQARLNRETGKTVYLMGVISVIEGTGIPAVKEVVKVEPVKEPEVKKPYVTVVTVKKRKLIPV